MRKAAGRIPNSEGRSSLPTTTWDGYGVRATGREGDEWQIVMVEEC